MKKTETVQKIKFKGLDFILIMPEDDDSAIATIEAFQKGECSYAHFYRDKGVIIQLQNQIGTTEDIEFGEMIEIEIDDGEFMEGILGNSWSL